MAKLSLYKYLFKKPSSDKGFTLIELLVVMAILATLTAMSSVIYSRLLLQNAVDNTTDQLIGSLRKAQTYSMTGRLGSSWGVNYSANTITLFKGISYASRDQSFDEKFNVNQNISISGLTDIYFNRMTGLAVPGTATITVNGNNNSKSFTMNNQGVISKN